MRHPSSPSGFKNPQKRSKTRFLTYSGDFKGRFWGVLGRWRGGLEAGVEKAGAKCEPK